MADVIVTLKVMPTGVEVDMNKLKKDVAAKIKVFDAKLVKEELELVAYGLKALKVIFAYPESRGGPDQLEEDIRTLDDVESAEVIDVRRAIG